MSAMDQIPNDGLRRIEPSMISRPRPIVVTEPPENEPDVIDQIGKTLAHPEGCQTIIDSMTGATGKIATYIIDIIDELQSKLDNLKKLVELKQKASVDSTTEFIKLVDQTRVQVEALGKQADLVSESMDNQ